VTIPPSLDWRTQALRDQIAPWLPGLSVEVLPSVPSTNSLLLDRARTAQAVQPALLVAEQQTAGRGRQGRTWHSEQGASLTFSLALPLQLADWSGLSLAVGVALADALDALDAHAVPRIGLKWPNDLWYLDAPGAGRKLGGILVETVSAGAGRLAVIGIGLNVLPLRARDASSGFACLRELDAAATAPGALHRIALPLAQALRRFEDHGFAAFERRFAVRDVLLGRPVRTESLQGFAEGVTAQGALRVRTDKALHEVHGGEVSVRLEPSSEAAQPQPAC
jgi:BirA family transcriptional regulator, biotin operon repressor / biotin---[acetyl-CoA-carboxylase] ligase